MTNRDHLADGFLANTDWAGAMRHSIAGDASNRRYFRLARGNGERAVLMDAPPEKGEDVAPFVRVARHLTSLGFSAPRILAEDARHGFLLLEDLGDDLFARVVERSPGVETEIYRTATSALVDLHRHDPPDWLEPYSVSYMTDMAALAYTHYLPGGTGAPAPESEARFRAAFTPLLDAHVRGDPVVIQRDYHAENLLWLPERSGSARVGMLDFQDAMKGHRAYDLVSLLEDARRDVPRAIQGAMIDLYLEQSGQDRDTFLAAYHVLGAQRNLRILGVFAWLCMELGKPHYINLVPRVWGYLMNDLAHPALSPVADMLRADLPEPTPAVLNALKDKCATRPTP